jgi:hypothetical protein
MALPRYYSSGCVAHGVCLLALAVAVLGFAEFASPILDFVTGVVFSTLSEEFVTVATLGLVASGFIVLFMFLVGRLFGVA